MVKRVSAILALALFLGAMSTSIMACEKDGVMDKKADSSAQGSQKG